MRFDDMLATALAVPLGNAVARASAWRQITDILAQRPAGDDGDEPVAQAFSLLRALRPRIPAALRAETARSLAGRTVSPDLVAFYLEDSRPTAAVVVETVRLDAAGWRAVLPAIKPPLRELVHRRADTDPAIAEATGLHEAPEAPLPVALLPLRGARVSGAEDQPKPAPGAFLWPLRPRSTETAEVPDAASGEARLAAFRFETDSAGIMIWTDAAPRGGLIGHSLAAAAGEDGQGVDGHAAGAFRHRAPFRDARLNLRGDGATAGEWRLSGVPFFDHADGRFLGYRGAARRPRRDETAAPRSAVLFDGDFPADSLRQLVHELRTPLNAVAGFAEMIDGQFLGPAAAPYRLRAADIVGEARRLLRAVDDLDVAARIETQRIGLDPGRVDATALLATLVREYGPLAEARGAALATSGAEGLWIEADAMAVDRMFARLLGSSVGLAAEGERIAADLTGEGEAVALRVTRPEAVAGRDERLLLDPGYTPDGDWPEAPLLGLGFTLRLIRNLAAAAGGRLDIADRHFVLSLPAAAAVTLRGEGQA